MKDSPQYGGTAFQCPHCQTVAQQQWFDLRSAGSTIKGIIKQLFMEYRLGIPDYRQAAISDFLREIDNGLLSMLQSFIPSDFAAATCSVCREASLWISPTMVYPRVASLPPPNDDLDDEIKSLYQEAESILTESAKGSAALLRLALQKLLKQLGKKGKNINSDIKELVSEGLSPKIQQALDLVRVVGNNAVHPGQIDLDDNTHIAHRLFELINFIADELITRPKELDSLYRDTIPVETQEHIKQRDGDS